VVEIFGEISDWWGKNLNELTWDLWNVSGPIHVKVNSPGGQVTEALGMMNYLRGLPNNVTVTGIGLVASAATFLLEAANTAQLSKHSFLMIHRPALGMMGNPDEMQSGTDALRKIEGAIEQIYLGAMKKRKKMIDGDEAKTLAQIQDWMKAETWMTAAEALERGFIDAISEDDLPSEAATDEAITPFEGSFSNFRNAPTRITNHFQKKNEMAKQEAKPKNTLPEWVQQLVNFFTNNADSGERSDKAEKPLKEEGDEIKKAKATLTAAGYLVEEPSDESGEDKDGDETTDETDATNQAAIDAAVAKALSAERAKNAKKRAGKPPVSDGETKPLNAEDRRNAIRAKHADKFEALAQAFKKR
jgi:ATP-dependent Clp protease protease subunit